MSDVRDLIEAAARDYGFVCRWLIAKHPDGRRVALLSTPHHNAQAVLQYRRTRKGHRLTVDCGSWRYRDYADDLAHLDYAVPFRGLILLEGQ